jgi:8-oxo-dGTP pyrophosphatase MutT (NUDIX family)
MNLGLDELRRRLMQRSAPAMSVYGDDGAGREAAALTAASVLVPIVAHEELSVVFTQRTSHLKHHSGQISFPGGRAEPEDPTPEFTALRETEEELGLARDRVEVLVRMPQYCTRTGFCITPVVGLLAPPLVLSPDRREVEEVFEVPLGFLLDPRNHERRTREYQGQMVGYYVIQYGERHIWGATAAMIVNLYRMIG